MGITGQDQIDSANRMVEVKFQEVFENDAEGPYKFFTEVIPTTSKENRVDVLGAMPVLREWVGAKQFADQRAYSQTATLTKHEASFVLDRMDVEYDSIGLIGRRINAFGSRMKYWYDLLAFDKLVANGLAYDDVSFFSASHPHGPDGATQSNTSTAELGVAGLEAAIVAMQELRDEKGETMGISPDLLVVGPNLAKKAMELTGSSRLQSVSSAGVTDAVSSVVGGAAVPNLYFGGMLNVLVWPRLVGSSYRKYWYTFSSQHQAKPVLNYEGRRPGLYAQTDMNGTLRFMNDKLAWSIESDDQQALGAWQVAYGGLAT